MSEIDKYAEGSVETFRRFGITVNAKKILDIAGGLGGNGKLWQSLGAEVWILDPVAVDEDVTGIFPIKAQDFFAAGANEEFKGYFDLVNISGLMGVEKEGWREILGTANQALKPDGEIFIGFTSARAAGLIGAAYGVETGIKSSSVSTSDIKQMLGEVTGKKIHHYDTVKEIEFLAMGTAGNKKVFDPERALNDFELCNRDMILSSDREIEIKTEELKERQKLEQRKKEEEKKKDYRRKLEKERKKQKKKNRHK